MTASNIGRLFRSSRAVKKYEPLHQRCSHTECVAGAFLWHSQQVDRVPYGDVSLIVVASALNDAVRAELDALGGKADELDRGVFRISGLRFAAYLVETDVMAERGEDFAMQHKDSEYLGEVEEGLLTSVLEAIPVERRLRGLTPEERLHGLAAEEVAAGLSEEQAARLRALLERKTTN